MKIITLAAALLATSLLAGCASNDAPAPRRANDAARRTYSADRLKSTGDTTVGPALQKTDPSIQVSGGR